MIDHRVFLLAGGCAVFAALIVVELYAGADANVAAANVSSPADEMSVAPRGQRPPLDEAPATILARPLFSPTRRPPESSGPTASELTDKRLAGIVIEPDRRLAIFAVSGAKPLVVTEGETVDGWRIENITPSEISLRGPSGSQTLQPRPDPNPPPPNRSQPPANAGARPAAPPGRGAPAAPVKSGPPPGPAANAQTAPGGAPRASAAVPPGGRTRTGHDQ